MAPNTGCSSLEPATSKPTLDVLDDEAKKADNDTEGDTEDILLSHRRSGRPRQSRSNKDDGDTATDTGRDDNNLLSRRFTCVQTRNCGKTWFGKVRSKSDHPKNSGVRTWTTPIYNSEEDAARAVDRLLYKLNQVADEDWTLNFPQELTKEDKAQLDYMTLQEIKEDLQKTQDAAQPPLPLSSTLPCPLTSVPVLDTAPVRERQPERQPEPQQPVPQPASPEPRAKRAIVKRSGTASSDSSKPPPVDDLRALQLQLYPSLSMGHHRGGRKVAADPRMDPNISPKRAARILANRLSAARSKKRQRESLAMSREKEGMEIAETLVKLQKKDNAKRGAAAAATGATGSVPMQPISLPPISVQGIHQGFFPGMPQAFFQGGPAGMMPGMPQGPMPAGMPFPMPGMSQGMPPMPMPGMSQGMPSMPMPGMSQGMPSMPMPAVPTANASARPGQGDRPDMSKAAESSGPMFTPKPVAPGTNHAAPTPVANPSVQNGSVVMMGQSQQAQQPQQMLASAQQQQQQQQQMQMHHQQQQQQQQQQPPPQQQQTSMHMGGQPVQGGMPASMPQMGQHPGMPGASMPQTAPPQHQGMAPASVPQMAQQHPGMAMAQMVQQHPGMAPASVPQMVQQHPSMPMPMQAPPPHMAMQGPMPGVDMSMMYPRTVISYPSYAPQMWPSVASVTVPWSMVSPAYPMQQLMQPQGMEAYGYQSPAMYPGGQPQQQQPQPQQGAQQPVKWQ